MIRLIRERLAEGRVEDHSSGTAMPWSPSALRGRPSQIA